MIRHLSGILLVLTFTASCSSAPPSPVGETTVTKWQHAKNGAVSITYDDGTINHFRVARPLMNELGLPGTFYIITGAIPGSEHEGVFKGRPVEEIIAETADTPTDADNFFERASAIRYSGYEEAYRYHTEAGGLYERGEVAAAYDAIDEGYAEIRDGAFAPTDDYSAYLYDVLFVDPDTELITWDELQSFDGSFHEFGSHTITHPYLAVLDEENLLYELEQSKEDILAHLGPEHTFSAEGPFGTEDERVMEYAHELYPALRNRMPEPFLDEFNRSSDADPTTSDEEYVQWQRGPLTDTPMDRMKSWIDTTIGQDNVWLVLVFHGVEGIGWEPKSEAELEEYFRYIKAREDDLWVATFKDVTKYIRQRMNAEVAVDEQDARITVNVTHTLGERYDLPLTLETHVPAGWSTVAVRQGSNVEQVQAQQEEDGLFVRYQAHPNAGSVVLVEEERTVSSAWQRASGE